MRIGGFWLRNESFKKIVSGFYMLLVAAVCTHAQDWRESVYFDTAFLSRYDDVCQVMQKRDGFVEGFFTTQDNVSINYLWLKRDGARYTVVLCSGFLPGRKEGLATFYALLPCDCNLLFFDARGHGKSGGQFLGSLWSYGLHEYKDVIGAICWAHEQQACPIIIYGVCSGAFHAARAVLDMEKRGFLQQYLVKALVFDSGWSSLERVARTGLKNSATEWVEKWFNNFWGSRAILSGIGCCMNGLYYCLIYPVLRMMGDSLNLADHISALTLPVFYIHAENDSYASIDDVKVLAQKTEHATCWWITEKSKHACHHLKLKEQYRERLLGFLESILAAH